MLAGNYADAIEKADDALRICLRPVDRAAAGGYRGAAVALSGKGHEDGRARTRLMEAREIAVSVEASHIVRDADAVLAELDAA